MNGRLLAATLGFAAALSVSAAVGAESDGGRASVPPGTSQDGSRPNEGAIKGGSIEGKKRSDDALEQRRQAERCRDLEGTLREQCLRDARSDRPPEKQPDSD
jgi:hypothetical protein